MATLSKRIERRDFICSPVISCLSKTTISHRNTVVHGPISWVGGLLVRVTILAWKVTCGGGHTLAGVCGAPTQRPVLGFPVPRSDFVTLSYEPPVCLLLYNLLTGRPNRLRDQPP